MMYTRKELCAAAKISPRQLDVMRAQGRGPAVTKVGRKVLISHAAAEEWLRSMEGREQKKAA